MHLNTSNVNVNLIYENLYKNGFLHLNTSNVNVNLYDIAPSRNQT